MDLLPYLKSKADTMVTEASTGVIRAHLRHYDAAGMEKTRERLQSLFERLVECIERRSLQPIVGYSQMIAEERYTAGFDLSEVQAAYNVLEEVVWRSILHEFPPSDFAEAIGLVSTVLGGGKDALARTYVSLATKTRAPSLDMRALFAGTGAGA